VFTTRVDVAVCTSVCVLDVVVRRKKMTLRLRWTTTNWL